jgi:hypothetical protein
VDAEGVSGLGDIESPRLLHAKAALFVALGGLASALLIAERPTLKVAALLALAVWAFARAYYFAFHVIEHYIDGDFQYAGLLSAARYLFRGGAGAESRALLPAETAGGGLKPCREPSRSTTSPPTSTPGSPAA